MTGTLSERLDLCVRGRDYRHTMAISQSGQSQELAVTILPNGHNGHRGQFSTAAPNTPSSYRQSQASADLSAAFVLALVIAVVVALLLPSSRRLMARA